MPEDLVVATSAEPVVASAPVATSTVAPATPEGGDTPVPNPADGAPADPETPETPEQAARKETSKRERKLARLHREIAEQKARAERAEQAERRWQEAEAKSRPPAEAPVGVKTLADFNFDPEAYADYKADQAKQATIKEVQQRQTSERNQQAQTKLTQSWSEKVTKADAKYEDWDEVVGDLKPTSPLHTAIMHPDLPNGEDVAYYLGTAKNHAEALRIAALDPFSQILAIGRLSATLAATPAKPNEPSKAPAPIKFVSGSGPTAKRLSDMSQDEFEKARRARIAQRR